nr:hypothetical protein BaRGS_006404 [Batillaria attramentaria]
MPSVSGTYSYNVAIAPGRLNVTAGVNAQISRPNTQPNHTCPSFVPESHSLSCTCKGDVGQPAGNALWRHSGTALLTVSNVQLGQDGDQYVCDVTWNGQVAQSTTYVLKVTSLSVTFTLNNMNSTLTVVEGEAVTLTCQANGGYDPNMQLIHRKTGKLLDSDPMGTQIPPEQTKELTHEISSATCGDIGVYVCDVSNDVGKTIQQTVQLLVQCGPKGTGQGSPVSDGETYPSINTGQSEYLKFGVTAYPDPQLQSVMYFTNDPSTGVTGQPAKDGVARVFCASRNDVSSDVICYVIVDANTSNDSGFYQAAITNGFGQFVFTFEVTEGVLGQTADGDLDTGTALVLGVVVMLFLDITIVVVLLIWLRRRHWILPCIASRRGDTRRRSLQPSLSTRESRGVSQNIELYETVDKATPQPGDESKTSDYEGLREADIGLVSAYSTLSPLNQAGAASSTGRLYENNPGNRTEANTDT